MTRALHRHAWRRAAEPSAHEQQAGCQAELCMHCPPSQASRALRSLHTDCASLCRLLHGQASWSRLCWPRYVAVDNARMAGQQRTLYLSTQTALP